MWTPPSKYSSSAPGKIILCGEHAVVHGSHALATVIDRRTRSTFAFTETTDNQAKITLRILDGEFAGTHSFNAATLNSIISHLSSSPDPSSPSDCLDRVLSLISPSPSPKPPICVGVFLLLIFHFPNIKDEISSLIASPFVLDCTVTSDVPIGAGLGSSASYSASLCTGFLRWSWWAKGKKTVQQGDLHKDIDLLNDWAFKCEQLVHGTPSGVDNTVVCYGGTLMYKRGSPFTFMKLTSACDLLVTNTKQEKSTKELVAKVGLLKESHPHIVGCVISAIDELCLRVAESLTKCPQNIDQVLHVVFPINQQLLDGLGVGHPKLTQVVEASRSVGLNGCKLTGAGGGGCAITVIPHTMRGKSQQDVENTNKAISEFKSKIASCGFECFQTTIGQLGATLHIDQETLT